MSSAPLSIGFSPCPNDTYIFCALVHGLVEAQGFKLAAPLLADVETLNRWALAGKLEISKLSFHALGHVLNNYVLLQAGSALGRGCGPLLVSREPMPPEAMAGKRLAIPGRYTTAALLMRLCLPAGPEYVEMRFDRIMPAIAAGEVEAGVIIHESRFTYERYGLSLVVDLGAWWEKETGCLLPLGGIAVRRSLGPAAIKAIDRAISASLAFANASPASCLDYLKQHAREMEEEVIQQHVNLYVNQHTVALGEPGVAAVREFLRRGVAAGAFQCDYNDFLLA